MPIARFLSFIALASGLSAFYAYPGQDGDLRTGLFDSYLAGYARLVGAVLGLFEPSVRVFGQDIVGRTSLRIIKGCDAMDVLLPLLSAIAVFPCSWRARLLALPVAVSALVTLNVSRICSLYYLQIYRPSYFDTVHMDVWPLLLVVCSVAGFAAWAGWLRARGRALAVPPAEQSLAQALPAGSPFADN